MAKKNGTNMNDNMNTNTTNNNTVNAPHLITWEEVLAHKEEIKRAGKRYKWDDFRCDDLFQEVAIKCCVKPGVIFDPGRGTLKALLATVASTTALDMWRRNKRFVQFEDGDFNARIDEEACYGYVSPLEQYVRKEKRELIQKGIQELQRKYPSKLANRAFLEFDLQERCAKDIAAELGKGEGYVNVAVGRGRERLGAIVKKLAREDAA